MIETAVAERPTRSDGGGTPIRIAVELASNTAEGADRRRCGEPVTMGLPFPRGGCADPRSLALIDADGQRRRLQARTLDRWPDGSVRWALLDFQADAAGEQRTRYAIVAHGTDAPMTAGPSVVVSRDGDGLSVNTGVVRFCLRPRASFPFEDVSLHGQPAIDPARTQLVLEAASGEHLKLAIDRVELEEEGPLRSVIVCEGVAGGRRTKPSLRVIARLHFFAGSATVRFALTLRNPEPAGHPGGCWTLGDRGSIFLRDVSLRIAPAHAAEPSSVACSPECATPYQRYDIPFELYQDSSGGERWNSSNHRNRDGVVPQRMRGYRLQAGTHAREGYRASPTVSLSRGPRSVAIAMPHFWQNFPKALVASDDSLTLGLFPRQYADVHEIQGGEQKTHAFFVAFDRDRVTSVPLDWCRAPLLARADPSWYCASGAVSYLTPTADDPHRQYVDLTMAAVEGDDTFERKREAIDEYGWRHFGDTYADHEAVFERGAAPLVSHYNNQYDAIAGFGYQFLRSSDSRWWTLMVELAAHVVDIDTYHTDADKAAYNQGLFWHTYHYMDAGTAGHRSFPRHPKVGGGGPSAEHNYSTGLLLHHFLTGDPMSRETAIELAQWVLAMDDGNQTIFRWLDHRATGLASAAGSALYHGPGRGAGNSIATLINGHRLTGDARFLAKAETIIRRTIHPADDLAARNLLDAERRWFYTVYLQALGKYLDYKIELQSFDRMYAYARASLLHYAAWMAEHEYPYLDRPEILEYPTETWAAQDMRKSDVFIFAAKHGGGASPARFLERAGYFFESSVSTLTRMSTRTLARPVTLMLTNGLMHVYVTNGTGGSAPAPEPEQNEHDFGAPEQFVPQKVRAMTRARLLAAGGVIGAVATLAGYLLM